MNHRAASPSQLPIRPDVLAKALPAPFRPKTYAGWGVGGICMIRFKRIHPVGVPNLSGSYLHNAYTQDRVIPF